MLKYIDSLTQRQAVTLLKFLYPIWAIVGMFSIMYVPSVVLVPGDALATAAKLMEHATLYRVGIIGNLLTQLLLIGAALALYRLFKPVSKTHALLVVVFGLVGVPIDMLSTLGRVAALTLASGAEYLTVFSPEQLHGLMLFIMDMQVQGMLIASVFWGLWLFPLGYLVYTSGYFPKILGWLVIVAGWGYLLAAIIEFIAPQWTLALSVLEVLTIGELVYMLWFIFKGVQLPATE